MAQSPRAHQALTGSAVRCRERTERHHFEAVALFV
ncbi:hypothetical protein QF026_005371 [Streptomyces aurantiacus]|nr:hypothetical protein [Streptomyces aurantiacus]